jgi:hypothetical protein
MGKYFSNDSDLVNYAADIDGMSVDMTSQTTIPNSAPKTQETLSDSQKEMLSRPVTSIDDKIEEIHEQNQEIKEQFNKIEKERVKQTFKSFDELEVLERLNQITFLLMQQNNRLNNIEEFLKSGSVTTIEKKTNNTEYQTEEKQTVRESEINSEPQDLSKMSPIERHKYETEVEKEVDFMNPTEVQREINKIQYGGTPSIPNEGLVDNSINLEETFPDREPEAYQAAYTAMEEVKKRNPDVGYSKSPKGGFNGAGAGF